MSAAARVIPAEHDHTPGAECRACRAFLLICYKGKDEREYAHKVPVNPRLLQRTGDRSLLATEDSEKDMYARARTYWISLTPVVMGWKRLLPFWGITELGEAKFVPSQEKLSHGSCPGRIKPVTPALVSETEASLQHLRDTSDTQRTHLTCKGDSHSSHCIKAFNLDLSCPVEEYRQASAKLKSLALRYRFKECFEHPALATGDPTLTATAFGDFVYDADWMDESGAGYNALYIQVGLQTASIRKWIPVAFGVGTIITAVVWWALTKDWGIAGTWTAVFVAIVGVVYTAYAFPIL